MPEKRLATVISDPADFEKELKAYLKPNQTLAILLDYDGTLAKISEDPTKVNMSPEIEIMLHKFAKQPNVFLAIISGRGLRDVQSKVGIEGITYAGNHGLEIQLADGTRHDYQLPSDMKASYTHLVQELEEQLNKNNAFIEDKQFSLTYHYRHTPLQFKEAQRARAIEIITAHGFRANQAHEAIEAKPPVNWNKGEAARYILETKFGNNWAQSLSIIFAGDDTTDEDVMKVLQGIGKSFRISTDPEIETYADYRLTRQDLMKDLLNTIGKLYIS